MNKNEIYAATIGPASLMYVVMLMNEDGDFQYPVAIFSSKENAEWWCKRRDLPWAHDYLMICEVDANPAIDADMKYVLKRQRQA